MNPAELKKLYMQIENQFDNPTLVLSRTIITAFATGLGKEPVGKVNNREANDRTLAYLLEYTQEFDLDYNEGWPGYVYYQGEERKVLGDPSGDPLKDILMQIVMLFHTDVALERSKHWYDDAQEQYEHAREVENSLRGMMLQVYYRRNNLQFDFAGNVT